MEKLPSSLFLASAVVFLLISIVLRVPKTVSHMMRNRAPVYVSFMSICWACGGSLALTGFLQFYSTHIHAFAIQIIKTLRFCFVNSKNPEIMEDRGCPPSVVMNNEMGSTSEKEKSQQSIKKWELDRIFNSNRDDIVSADDIQGLLEKLGIRYFCDDNMKIMMDFPEHMSFDEFCRCCVGILEEGRCVESMQGLTARGELKEAFCVFDKNGDGFITPCELQDVLLSLGLTEARNLQNCEAMITRFDKNSDGRIDFEEFENMLTPLNRPL
ncbi:hypothetical protein KI387_036264 [Taxus chinensis]|uniref:EF-hand domain-containing protein n=1 Tax=Taxus chinensis TaxID=29808 RepID=A0AA38FT63_TAXCH|nr:hypothetical protein KI387_036264 [Taxus chinensis]